MEWIPFRFSLRQDKNPYNIHSMTNAGGPVLANLRRYISFLIPTVRTIFPVSSLSYFSFWCSIITGLFSILVHVTGASHSTLLSKFMTTQLPRLLIPKSLSALLLLLAHAAYT